jgi:hypothetical protein
MIYCLSNASPHEPFREKVPLKNKIHTGMHAEGGYLVLELLEASGQDGGDEQRREDELVGMAGHMDTCKKLFTRPALSGACHFKNCTKKTYQIGPKSWKTRNQIAPNSGTYICEGIFILLIYYFFIHNFVTNNVLASNVLFIKKNILRPLCKHPSKNETSSHSAI